MKKFPKILSLITVLLVMSTLFSGFSKVVKDAKIINGVDVTNPVELTMYLVGDAQPVVVHTCN